ncbi:MAG: HRDC domain-containing protein, partial [Anaeromyxobacteraceae bacterium]
PKERSARPRVRRATSALSSEADLELFERLREWRSGAAREAELPAFVILSDATLTEIALARPRTEDALLQVSGIGPRKLEAFGDAILRLVRKS